MQQAPPLVRPEGAEVAVDQGDHYLLNGTKNWITNGSSSRLHIVIAQTDTETLAHTAIIEDPPQEGIDTCEQTLFRPLQIAGLNTGYTDVVSRRGEGRTASFWYYDGDMLLAVDAMNDPRAYMIGKRLIEAGKTADPAIVADPDADLKTLLQA